MRTFSGVRTQPIFLREPAPSYISIYDVSTQHMPYIHQINVFTRL